MTSAHRGEDLIDVPNYTIRIKLMIDGAPSRPFGATTLTPKELEEHLRRWSH